VPLGILNFVLALRTLPVDSRSIKAERVGFDTIGTLLLAVTLVAYALAMTIGGGRFDMHNVALLSAAFLGITIFAFAERKAASPLLQLAMFCDPSLSASLVMSALVSTVLMSTLVVGPFYLSRELGLDVARVGLVMSVGPLAAALTGVPAGRIVDRFGARRMGIVGLIGMSVGLVALSTAPARFGVAGYVAAIVIVTSHYALFQTSINTTIMTDVAPEQRGVVSGMLSLSRNLGLITGASLMGALFASEGMRVTFTVAALLILAALAIAARRRSARITHYQMPGSSRDGTRTAYSP
jgi:predicted MFS family arabinose efflux permease